MANPLFRELNQQNNGMANIMRQIESFRRSFTGDPKAEVERLMRSGRMTQEQFNQLAQQTNQIMQTLKR